MLTSITVTSPTPTRITTHTITATSSMETDFLSSDTATPIFSLHHTSDHILGTDHARKGRSTKAALATNSSHILGSHEAPL